MPAAAARPSARSGSCAPGSAGWSATSAARSRARLPSRPPSPGRSDSIARLLRQRREDRGRDKLYSLHAPEVECIGKGKAQARYEFGVKVSIATTNAAAPGGQFVLGARALPGNPYDGHTLAAQIAQTERITGVAVERAYVDRGYRGHDADDTRVFISGQKRGITPTIRRELRRRNAIEPRHRPPEERRPSRPQLPARHRGRRHQRRPRRRRPQPPPAPRLAGLALCVPALPPRSAAPDCRHPAAETQTRVKTGYFTGDSVALQEAKPVIVVDAGMGNLAPPSPTIVEHSGFGFRDESFGRIGCSGRGQRKQSLG